jgi:hypothetical protein
MVDRSGAADACIGENGELRIESAAPVVVDASILDSGFSIPWFRPSAMRWGLNDDA